jgi:hypothetical protein
MGERSLRLCKCQRKIVVRKQIALPSCFQILVALTETIILQLPSLPVANASELHAFGLAVLRLHILHPFVGNFFCAFQMLVLPRLEIEVGIT